MKLFVVVLLVAAALAERLENTYLPPSSARQAGGSGSFLAAPTFGVTNPISTSYLAPVAAKSFSGSFSTPAVVPRVAYGVPVANVQTYSGPATPAVPIIRLNNDNNGDGSYRYEYETANHIAAQESGHLAGEENLVQGSYSYLAPSGQTISVSYVADGNGFRAAGDHLPTPPPIPEAILKSLEINAADEARGIFDDGQYRPSASDLSVSYKGASLNSQYLPPTNQQGGYRY